MATSPIDLSAGLVPKTGGIDLSAGLVPKEQPDTRTLLQKAKDKFGEIQSSFDANTKTSPSEPLAETGLKSVVRTIGTPFVHPIATAESVKPQSTTEMVFGPAATAARQLFEAGKGVVADYKEGGAGYAATKAGGQLIGVAALGKAVAAGPEAVAGVAEIPNRLYPQSQSLAMDVSGARNLAKSLVVDPAGVSNFIKAATDEAGTVVDYAKKNNIPINSKVDFANAAKQTADVVQKHFDSILDPNSKQVVAVPASYRGPTVGEGPNATLGEINTRIDAINQELNPNFRKGLAAQTNAANVSDADLIAEKRALTNVLHNKLAAATGLTPQDIAAVRQQAGKLRTLADEANLSANRDLTASGKQDMGATTSAVGTKTGIVDRALQMAQGGPEIIGNRNLNNALRKITPKPLNLPRPLPVIATDE